MFFPPHHHTLTYFATAPICSSTPSGCISWRASSGDWCRVRRAVGGAGKPGVSSGLTESPCWWRWCSLPTESGVHAAFTRRRRAADSSRPHSELTAVPRLRLDWHEFGFQRRTRSTLKLPFVLPFGLCPRHTARQRRTGGWGRGGAPPSHTFKVWPRMPAAEERVTAVTVKIVTSLRWGGGGTDGEVRHSSFLRKQVSRQVGRGGGRVGDKGGCGWSVDQSEASTWGALADDSGSQQTDRHNVSITDSWRRSTTRRKTNFLVCFF